MRAKSRNDQGGATRFRDQRGAAVVEFAIASLLFLGLLYGIVTFGIIFMVKNDITHAAEAGARAAISGTSATEQRTKAKSRACDVISGLPSTMRSDVVVGPGGACTPLATVVNFPIAACANDAQATCITVTVKYPYAAHPVLPPLPLFGAALPDEIEHTSIVQLTQ